MTLREIRFKRGLTLLDLMLATGINGARLSLAERGYQDLKKYERLAIASVLEMDVKDIDFDVPAPNKLQHTVECG